MLPLADGLVAAVHEDGSAVTLRERSLQVKLDLLFSKHLYTVALTLARTEQVPLPGPPSRERSVLWICEGQGARTQAGGHSRQGWSQFWDDACVPACSFLTDCWSLQSGD